MKASLFVVLFFGLLANGCAISKNKAGTAVLQPSALQPVGRYAMQDGQLHMISSAMHFGFSFEGTVCTLRVASPDQHNYLQYELDGVYQKRVRVEKGDGGFIEIKSSTAGRHTVWVYKATEAHTGAVIVKSIEGKSLKALPAPRDNGIEFIGNSITCGAAADPSEVPCGTGAYHDQHNAYMAYGPRLARSLQVPFMLSSVSGIGIYRNWNSQGPTMPQVYEKTTLRADGKENWDFNKFTPKVVSIALGTNDFSNGDGKSERLPFDSALFVNQYITFVQGVQLRYPQAQIALLSSPMVHGERSVLLKNCIMAVQQNGEARNTGAKPIAVFFFEPMQARGCSGHPNVEDHAIMAQALNSFFKKLLKE